ncbi:MAG TPA: glycosyl hydrolase, partial [Chitinophagaceae bacterium]|nr:glycosyl hydrolase [Chitinophagaceae bacterium]
MLQKLLISSILLVLGFATSTIQKIIADKDTGSLTQITEEFKNPPMSVKPGAFWCWLNGNMSAVSITRDLEAMKSKGINRAEIWDVAAVKNPSFIPAGGEFLGDESVSLIKHAISEGKRLKMKIGIVAS